MRQSASTLRENETMARIIDTVEALERLVDAHGLLHVLTGLEIMCDEKAEHIRANWQDIVTSKVWNDAGKSINKLARKIEPMNI
jgi:hypothetical protein